MKNALVFFNLSYINGAIFNILTFIRLMFGNYLSFYRTPKAGNS
mgnify:CR=1 FL=1